MTEQNAPAAFPPMVSIRNVKVYFPVRRGVFGSLAGYVKAVDDVSFSVRRGEVFALVGESGCGKTTVAQAALGLVRHTGGEVRIAAGPWKSAPTGWEGLDKQDTRTLRRHLQVIFQDPYSSLNPRMTVQSIVAEPLVIHRIGNRRERLERVAGLLHDVGLSADFLNRYPHEFSGGQRQRIGIARALACKPEVIIADEPVSALDVSIRAQIINLLQDLQRAYSLSMLFISHDLAVVRHLADRVSVMYLGRIMEMGTGDQIFGNPLHPYTHLLLDSVPGIGKGRRQKGFAVADEKTDAAAMSGCPFYPRCPKGSAECLERSIEPVDAGEGHLVACINQVQN